jgi:chromosome segregation ATPase
MQNDIQPQIVPTSQEQHVEELAGPEDFWLTITDAARATRRQDVSIRRWIAKGLLPVRRQSVGLNQRTRLVRASDLAKLTPIIDPAGAISTAQGRLDLTSIPVQQAHIKATQQQISTQLDQLLETIKSKAEETRQALDGQRIQQEQQLTSLRNDIETTLEQQRDSFIQRFGEIETALARQREGTAKRFKALTEKLIQQRAEHEQALNRLQASITATETKLSQQQAALQEQLQALAQDWQDKVSAQQQDLADLSTRLTERIDRETQEREQLADYIMKLTSSVMNHEQQLALEQLERQHMAVIIAEQQAAFEHETGEHIALTAQLAQLTTQYAEQEERNQQLLLTVSQQQQQLTSLQEQIAQQNNDYKKYLSKFRDAEQREAHLVQQVIDIAKAVVALQEKLA